MVWAGKTKAGTDNKRALFWEREALVGSEELGDRTPSLVRSPILRGLFHPNAITVSRLLCWEISARLILG